MDSPPSFAGDVGSNGQNVSDAIEVLLNRMKQTIEAEDAAANEIIERPFADSEEEKDGSSTLLSDGNGEVHKKAEEEPVIPTADFLFEPAGSSAITTPEGTDVKSTVKIAHKEEEESDEDRAEKLRIVSKLLQASDQSFDSLDNFVGQEVSHVMQEDDNPSEVIEIPVVFEESNETRQPGIGSEVSEKRDGNNIDEDITSVSERIPIRVMFGDGSNPGASPTESSQKFLETQEEKDLEGDLTSVSERVPIAVVFEEASNPEEISTESLNDTAQPREGNDSKEETSVSERVPIPVFFEEASKTEQAPVGSSLEVSGIKEEDILEEDSAPLSERVVIPVVFEETDFLEKKEAEKSSSQESAVHASEDDVSEMSERIHIPIVFEDHPENEDEDEEFARIEAQYENLAPREDDQNSSDDEVFEEADVDVHHSEDTKSLKSMFAEVGISAEVEPLEAEEDPENAVMKEENSSEKLENSTLPEESREKLFTLGSIDDSNQGVVEDGKLFQIDSFDDTPKEQGQSLENGEEETIENKTTLAAEEALKTPKVGSAEEQTFSFHEVPHVNDLDQKVDAYEFLAAENGVQDDTKFSVPSPTTEPESSSASSSGVVKDNTDESFEKLYVEPRKLSDALTQAIDKMEQSAESSTPLLKSAEAPETAEERKFNFQETSSKKDLELPELPNEASEETYEKIVVEPQQLKDVSTTEEQPVETPADILQLEAEEDSQSKPAPVHRVPSEDDDEGLDSIGDISERTVQRFNSSFDSAEPPRRDSFSSITSLATRQQFRTALDNLREGLFPLEEPEPKEEQKNKTPVMDSPASDLSPNAPPTGEHREFYEKLNHENAPPTEHTSAEGSLDSSGFEKVDHDTFAEYNDLHDDPMQKSTLFSGDDTKQPRGMPTTTLKPGDRVDELNYDDGFLLVDMAAEERKRSDARELPRTPAELDRVPPSQMASHGVSHDDVLEKDYSATRQLLDSPVEKEARKIVDDVVDNLHYNLEKAREAQDDVARDRLEPYHEHVVPTPDLHKQTVDDHFPSSQRAYEDLMDIRDDVVERADSLDIHGDVNQVHDEVDNLIHKMHQPVISETLIDEDSKPVEEDEDFAQADFRTRTPESEETTYDRRGPLTIPEQPLKEAEETKPQSPHHGFETVPRPPTPPKELSDEPVKPSVLDLGPAPVHSAHSGSNLKRHGKGEPWFDFKSVDSRTVLCCRTGWVHRIPIRIDQGDVTFIVKPFVATGIVRTLDPSVARTMSPRCNHNNKSVANFGAVLAGCQPE
ncbi:unnamed protein product [Caenorhabditis auriculariae]|uniref:Uncharacterized protein n=1 Tax=Caenorhabditis auriculariae TaxID=2777116 RepID=A0A8S1GUT6_9PELO|nr:unnamed protein product [Caenorhabditis auriculariae]